MSATGSRSTASGATGSCCPMLAWNSVCGCNSYYERRRGRQTYHAHGLAEYPYQSLVGDGMRARVEEVGEGDVEEAERG